MGREIKFRVWDERGFMIYDFEELDTSGLYNKYERENVFWDYNKYIKLNDVFKDNNFMQYTGLKDMNGKEIYEGDIVQEVLGVFKAIVVWSEHRSGFLPFCKDMPEFSNEECLVIGNIYENP